MPSFAFSKFRFYNILMMPVHVFFFRGLSTYGSDHAQWSLINLGYFHRHLRRELAQAGIQLHPVLGMGAGSLDCVTERAYSFLKQHPVWNDPSATIHLLGHSAGGLIARLIEATSPRTITSCVTVATAHQGAILAERCLAIPGCFPATYRALQCLGYDMARKENFFAELTRAAVQNRMRQLKPQSAQMASIVCSAPRVEWCWPIRAFHHLPPFREFSEKPCDGFVERDSQPFGEVLAEIAIDHFQQVGFFDREQRFEKLCRILGAFFQQSKR